MQAKSLHRPKFQRSQYEGVVTGVGVMATELNAPDKPLRILATDEDYGPEVWNRNLGLLLQRLKMSSGSGLVDRLETQTVYLKGC